MVLQAFLVYHRRRYLVVVDGDNMVVVRVVAMVAMSLEISSTIYLFNGQRKLPLLNYIIKNNKIDLC